jgi:hypothetical protein
MARQDGRVDDCGDRPTWPAAKGAHVNASSTADFEPRPKDCRQAVRRCIEALALGWLMLLAALPALAQTDRVWTINEAQVVLSDSPSPPADSAAWKTQALPDL